MSYILEALKKSQQERELGKVPTLDTAGMFDEDKAEPARSPWPLVAIGLAASAVLIALYAAFRAPTPVYSPGPVASAPVSELPESKPRLVEQTPLAVQDLDGLSVAPRPVIPPLPMPGPLVEPPPPKRASQPVGSVVYGGQEPPGLADLADEEAELELQRQLEAESEWEDYPYEYEEPEDPPTPVPRDLIADIEAFKKSVDLERGTPAKQSAKAGAGDPTRLRLTPREAADLPPFLMTVHVYDSVETKRFILINGVKYREGARTREGLKVDQILKNGAVLKFQGKPFFVHR